MTENTKVSAFAFSVPVLGLLSFFVPLAADVFLSPSATTGGAPPTPTLPAELQDRVMQGRPRTGRFLWGRRTG